MTAHGGDVWEVAEETGIPASELLDFSANINPRGLPPRALVRLARDAADSRLQSRYPDPSARLLRKALAEQLGIGSEAIVIGPGAESLFAPILQSIRARRALIPVPAFGEYRRVCVQRGIEIEPFLLSRSECFRMPIDRFCHAIRTGGFDVVFLNNPHNPSGTALRISEVKRILEVVREVGAALILDEAFIDYTPDETLVAEAASGTGLVVLRSLTKIYGCPALRVGFAVAEPTIAQRIAGFLSTWPVTQLALDTLTEAVADSQYLSDSVRENATEREELAESLRVLGLVVFPSVANYLLLELAKGPSSAELRKRMIRNHRILLRNCDSYEGLTPGRYLRVAVRSADENLRLVQALSQEL